MRKATENSTNKIVHLSSTPVYYTCLVHLSNTPVLKRCCCTGLFYDFWGLQRLLRVPKIGRKLLLGKKSTPMVFLWLDNQRIEEDDISGLQTRHVGLLWRRLQSPAEAVLSAGELPVWHGSELVLGQSADQDQDIQQKEVNPPSGQTQSGHQRPYLPILFMWWFQNQCLCLYDYPSYPLTYEILPTPSLRSLSPDSSGISPPTFVFYIYIYVFYY